MRKNKLFLTVVGLLLAVVAQAYETVDLGLPSRTLWATTNVGASSETDLGSYYAWAETSVKTEYSQPNYVYQTGITQEGEWGASKLTKYCAADGKTVLDGSDDAATQACGSTWVTPTTEQLNELINECTWTLEGNGYRVTGKNGKSIYLPLAGYRYDGPGGTGTHDATTRGCYLANSCASTYSTCNYLDIRTDGSNRVSNVNRFYGMSVRPVSTEKAAPTPLVLSDLTISKNEGRTLAPTFTGTATWTSSNPTVAHVDNEGHVSGMNGGTATITATLEDGTIASCTVTVNGSYFEGYDWAYSQYYIDGVYYTLSSSTADVTFKGKTCTSYYDDYSGVVIIPAIVSFGGNKYDVVKVNKQAFYSCYDLTEVYIRNGNKPLSIDYQAFCNCNKLFKLDLGNRVSSVDASAFANCSSMRDIYVSDLLVWLKICSNIMSAGTATKNLYVDGVELVDLTVPEGPTSIVTAFKGVQSIKTVNLSNSVTSISTSAFEDCTNLTSLSLGNSVTSIGTSAFQNCSNLTSLSLGNTVTYIGTSAFQNCSNLETVNFGGSSPTIYDKAFQDCSNLTSIYLGDNIPSLNSNTFSGCSNLKDFYITNLSSWCNSTSVYKFTQVGSSNKRLFVNGEELTAELILPDGVPTIYSYTFAPFNALRKVSSIVIPISVTTIQDNAFSGASILESLTMPSVGMIGKMFGQSSFDGSMEITQTVSYSQSAKYYIPKNLKTINIIGDLDIVANAFQKCSNVEEVHIGDGISRIGSSAFSGCTGLLSVTMGNSVTTIGNNAFYGCTGLPSVTIGNSVTTIGSSAFSGCTSLASFDLPNSVTSIDYSAFNNCSGLTSVTIGNSVATIGSTAFSGCSPYMTITISAENVPTLSNSNAFADQLIFVPTVSLQAYRDATNWSAHKNQILPIGTKTEYEVTVTAESETSAVYKAIGEANLFSVEKLKVSGTINSYDIMIMRNQMPNLKDLDLSNATIKANNYEYYTGYHTEDNQIGPQAFYSALYNIKLPVNLEGSLDMNRLSNLKEIVIPRGITKLSNEAFYGCKALKSITFASDAELTSIGSKVFYDCQITSISIPGNCTKIDKTVFEGCPISELKLLAGKKLSVDTQPYLSIKYLFIDRSYSGSIHTSYYGADLVLGENAEVIDGMYLESYHPFNSLRIPDLAKWCNDNQRRLIAGPKTIMHFYVKGEEVIDLLIPENVSDIPERSFASMAIQSVTMHPDVTTIGAYAFQNCTALEEVHIPSMMKSIGDYAFNGCSKLNDVYTYTVEPQVIDQNTFSTYTTATLHCPAKSQDLYLFDTQWSQFLKRVPFDEDYEKFFIGRTDHYVNENTGTYGGTPDVEIGAGAGLIVENVDQYLDEVHVGFDGTTNKGASLIGRVHANKIYLDLSVKADYWYYFCFPFNVDLATIQKSGGYIFRYYDGDQRANGGSGWRDIAAGTTHLNAGQGYIFRTNEAGTLTIVVDKKTVEANDLTVDKLTQLTAHEATSGETAADNKGWNFIGNPYISYYDINELGYTAPMVTWNGTSYEALRPGDDDYTLYPFQAFFVQKPENVDNVGFETSGTTTYIQSQEGGSSKAKASKAKASKAQAMDRNRQLINLTLTDGTATDKTRVVFNDKQQLTYETECDASKFSLTAGVPQLYSVDAEGIKYSINERPVDNGTVTLGYQAPEDGIYTISATRMDAHVALYDAARAITHDLAKGNYTFNSEAGKFENRFSLIMVGETTGIDSIDADAAGGVDNTYDLSGRYAKNVKKGVVIKNNKKVVIK